MTERRPEPTADPPSAPRRVADAELVARVRAAIGAARREGKIVTEVRLSQARWNALSPEMKVGQRAGRSALLFDGLPCSLSVGLTVPEGFAVRTVEPRE